MILIDTKVETTSSSSPLNLSNSEEKPTLSFGELLKGVTLKKDDKLIQNGALVLSLEGDMKEIKESPKSLKKETLLSLLKTDDKESVKGEPLELNPKLTENLSVKEIKTLIAGAKEYLKDKILQSDDYKNAQIKELPKTLKGLTELAQKIGIDISKITIEEVQVKASVKELPKLTVKENRIPQNSDNLKNNTKTSVEIIDTPKEKVLTKDTVGISKEKVLTKETAEISKEKVPTKETVGISKEKVPTKETVGISKERAEISKEKVSEKGIATFKAENKNQDTQIVEDKKVAPLKQPSLPKDTPLFKAQTQREHTTEQLVATKAFKVEEKTPKTRADETLKLLLRGEKPSQVNPALTADFSVTTAKVIAPSASSEATSARAQQGKPLESLLRGESSETSTTSSKTDGLSTLKSDSFEVKLNEAKQMIKYLSTDVKTAIEDYKSPFTRVKVQLNPQKLGEVDLTIVQRGKNLHINLSSNSTAINTLSMNANELRTQLNNNGINNASLNFNNSEQNSESNAQQQQQNRQNEQKANEEYNYFENEEANEEVLSSLEIIVPQYG